MLSKKAGFSRRFHIYLDIADEDNLRNGATLVKRGKPTGRLDEESLRQVEQQRVY